MIIDKIHHFRSDRGFLKINLEYQKKESEKLKGIIEILMDNGKMNFELLESLPLKYFNKDISIILNDLASGMEESTDLECNDDPKQCIKQDTLSKLTYKMSFSNGIRQKFGSFLRSIAPMILDNFNEAKYHTMVCFFGGCKKNLCKNLSQREKHLHQYFANLSANIGFTKKISLFEIPSILSYNINLLMTKKADFFMDHRCNKLGQVLVKEIMDCAKIFSNFLDQMEQGEKGRHLLKLIREGR